MAEPAATIDEASRDRLSHRRVMIVLSVLLAAAFAARLGARLYQGETHFFTQGYTSLYRLAETIVESSAFCRDGACPRPPLYPLLLTPAVLAGKNWLFIIIPQALIGTGTALMAFLIGRDLFNARAGLIACAIAAFYPYYVVHDTALQDTALATFALALAVWLTLRAASSNHGGDWLLAGLALGATLLVRAALAPTIALMLIWIVLYAPGAWRQRGRHALIAAVMAIAVVSPWLAYTARVTGTPTLSTDVGYELWVSNNPHTFSRFPRVSIDASSSVAHAQFSSAERAALAASPGNSRRFNGWYGHRARDYIAAHPRETLRGALRKIAIAFSARITPYRSGLAQWTYAASYLPVAILGSIGMLLAWRRRATMLVALLFVAFIAVTAVFSAQTSHRVYLDVYWMVFAALVIDRGRRSGSTNSSASRSAFA